MPHLRSETASRNFARRGRGVGHWVEAEHLFKHASSFSRLLVCEASELDAELGGHDLFEDRLLVREVGVESP